MITSKVYITKAKMNYLIKCVDISRSNINLDNCYIKDLGRILSDPERKKLALYRELMSNPDKLTLGVYVQKAHKDTRRYVYEKESHPSYHKDKHCIALHSNFENYEIPAEIHELEKQKCREYDVIEEYRKFFKDNEDLYKENRPAFLAQVGIKFKVRINNVKEVRFSNSGIEEIEDISSEKAIERIEKQIDELLNEMEEFRNIDEEHKKQIRDYGYGTHRANINGIRLIDDKNSIIYKWHEYKNKLKELIEEYFRIKLNPDFGFNQSMLDDLGFKPCYHCCT
jgi:hypothetical protein